MSAASRPLRVSCLGFVFDPFAQAEISRVVPPGLELLFCEQGTDIPDLYLRDADMLMVVAPVTEALLARAPNVRFIQKWGTGYEKIDLDAAARRGIPVAITAGANAETIAEHTLALILTVLRRIVVADRALREGRWIPAELRPFSHKLRGKTVGIVGMGNIGRALARLLDGFGVDILYHRPSGALPGAEARGWRFAARDELLARSDIVTLHAPGGAANRHLIDAPALARMKPGSVLINVSRGELADEAALVESLRGGHLSAAGLDVFEREPLPTGSPLRDMDNVVLTPHSAGSVMEDVALMAGHGFRNILAFRDGRPLDPADVVVDPAVEPWRSKRLPAAV